MGASHAPPWARGAYHSGGSAMAQEAYRIRIDPLLPLDIFV